ncbi:MAG: hypothetical protein HY924_00755 [Elusimicrobia bacterium]|nr:hypothetical protein [Elusimicrobiota bacterium]
MGKLMSGVLAAAVFLGPALQCRANEPGAGQRPEPKQDWKNASAVPAERGLSVPDVDDAGAMLIVDFEVRHGDRVGKCSVAVEEGSQANYSSRGNKSGQDLMCNVLPVLVPGGKEARMELQVELSAPGKDKVAFQVQTSVRVALGVEKVLVDSPDGRLTVKVRKL